MSRNRFTLLALLSGRAHDYAHLARPLLHSLERTHHFAIEVAEDFGALDEGRARVLLAASDVPLDGAQAERLDEFVRRGGGVVLLHGTLATWSEHDAIAEMAGWRLGQPAPLTELVIRVTDHPVTERLTPEVRVEDELYVSEGPPAEANVLLRASWRFSDQVVAYERQHGDGRFVQIGLGHGAATYQQPDFQKLVHRAVLFASGVAPAPKVGVGLIGYGAIARGHAESVSAISGLDMRSVCDISPERRELAARDLGVKTYSTADELLRDPDIELVVVGTPPSVHADPVVAALRAGKHVVCEKPFAIAVDEVDRMIDAAAVHQRVWHDVTNADQVRVDLTFDGGAQAMFMQSDIAAALKPKWYVLGTRGAVLAEWREDAEPPADAPARVKVLRPANGGGTHEERLALAPRDEHGFYRNLADHLAWDEPLAVTPQEARRTVAVMEAATQSIAQGGARLEVDI